MGWWSISVFWFLGSQLEKLYAIEVLYSFILCFLEIFPKLLEDHLQVGKPWTKLPQNVKWDWAKDGRTLAREPRTYPTLRWQNSDTSTFCSWTSHDSAGELKNKCGWEDEQSGWCQNAATAVQFSRAVVSDSATPWTAAHQASLSITNSRSWPNLMSIESGMPSNHLILCPLLLPSIFPNIRVFSNESALCIRWPKYCSFSFSISPSHEHSGLISFRMDWLDLLAVQGTLMSLRQHHSSKASNHPFEFHDKFLVVTCKTLNRP